ncbi:hypothetical protein BH18ACI3_BH18ACI3_05980 [soil metagenome]
MPKTNFENLRVYQFSEELADEVWSIVTKWDYCRGHGWEAVGSVGRFDRR